MRYRDVAAAVEWLCSAFGFEKQTVALSDTGTVLYAQLTYGNAMLMLAPVRDTSVDQFMKQPDEIGGGEYRRPYNNCNCGGFNCYSNCNCNCACACDCNCACGDN